MSERELVQLFGKSWMKIIIAQLAPTFLLITTVGLMQFGLIEAPFSVRLSAALILLASGILGALAEFSAADEAIAIAKSAAKALPQSVIVQQLVVQAKLLPVVKFVTPAIFVAIFVAILFALFA
ncbi:MAG: hypothetical protein RL100_425 [Actinomycetota bacterium]